MERTDERLPKLLNAATGGPLNILKYMEDGPWIPCSRRLPYANGRYLASVVTFIGAVETIAIVAYTDHGWYTIDDVVAWMPLPEIYKEKEDA